MQTVLVPPNSDAGPNDYTPSPIQAHYLNVREDPHDGDATVLITFGGSREVWGLDVSAIPDGSTIVKVTIRSAQKQTAAGPNTYRVGFRIGETDYPQPNHVIGTGSAYLVANDEVPADPSDGAAWTKDRLARALLVHEQISQTQGLPRPRVTECVVLAQIVPPPDRPSGTPAGRAPSASSLPGPGAAAATPASVAPSGGSVSGAPSASSKGIAPSASGASANPAGSSAGAAPRAVTVEDLDSLRVTLSSLAPRATAASASPAATPSAPAPARGEGS